MGNRLSCDERNGTFFILCISSQNASNLVVYVQNLKKLSAEYLYSQRLKQWAEALDSRLEEKMAGGWSDMLCTLKIRTCSWPALQSLRTQSWLCTLLVSFLLLNSECVENRTVNVCVPFKELVASEPGHRAAGIIALVRLGDLCVRWIALTQAVKHGTWDTERPDGRIFSKMLSVTFLGCCEPESNFGQLGGRSAG